MSTPTVFQTSKILPNSTHALPPSQSRVDAMAASIKDIGILEPILVRKVGHRYEITPGGGMVRWLAATKLGMDIVPIRVMRLDDEDCAAASLIANMTREPIAPEETVASLERLIEEFGENAAELVMEQLPDLRDAAASNPELQARINAVLARCKINSEKF
ncbi:ParB/RepB/Spo0J family partition protein [Pseudomonas sp. 460]|uniref:ParB/RepB/Spo0J family partition protein n=1 Tax=Pseudomonas sp. 460 TaxID=2485142 RepID=UPI00104783CA|nr:ParB/RepB/Spo0J family partition protein [Pseudomonas sp. 460]TCV51402.1 ParB family chromosome partitioning protein [Pseudomonas sp. 460]